MGKVLFIYGKNVSGAMASYRRGETPAHVLYGYPFLKDFGIDADIYDSGDATFWNRLKQRATRLFGVTGGGIIHLRKVIFKLPSYDVIVMVNYDVVMLLMVLKMLFFRRKRFIFFNNRMERLIGKSKVKKFLFGRCDKIVYYTKYLCEQAEALFPGKVTYFYQGSDCDFHKPDRNIIKGDYVLSVGADPGRDFDMLIDTARELEDIKFIIVAPKHLLAGKELSPNVAAREPVPPLELRELYQKARLVVIPLHSDDYPRGSHTPGLTVLCECMCTGKAVIISHRQYVSEYLVDGVSGQIVPPENKDELKRAIRDLWDNPQKCELLEQKIRKLSEKFNTRNWSKQIADIIKSL
ncbi:glycosyltransferase family 4 protein [Chloroflexota bacterium]